MISSAAAPQWPAQPGKALAGDGLRLRRNWQQDVEILYKRQHRKAMTFSKLLLQLVIFELARTLL